MQRTLESQPAETHTVTRNPRSRLRMPTRTVARWASLLLLLVLCAVTSPALAVCPPPTPAPPPPGWADAWIIVNSTDRYPMEIGLLAGNVAQVRPDVGIGTNGFWKTLCDPVTKQESLFIWFPPSTADQKLQTSFFGVEVAGGDWAGVMIAPDGSSMGFYLASGSGTTTLPAGYDPHGSSAFLQLNHSYPATESEANGKTDQHQVELIFSSQGISHGGRTATMNNPDYPPHPWSATGSYGVVKYPGVAIGQLMLLSLVKENTVFMYGLRDGAGPGLNFSGVGFKGGLEFSAGGTGSARKLSNLKP